MMSASKYLGSIFVEIDNFHILTGTQNRNMFYFNIFVIDIRDGHNNIQRGSLSV